jgi:MFS family permease
LITTIVVIGGATGTIGLLPTYDSIGIVAPILLATLRFIQGLSLGGEWSGAILMAVEHAPEEKRSFYGAMP